MKRLSLLLLPLLLLAACKKPSEVKVEIADVVSAAAQLYYENLLTGNVDAFIDGTYRVQSLRPEHRKELQTNVDMFLRQAKAEHGGLRSVDILSTAADTTAHAATVVLTLSFNDGARENVAVPMAEADGVWYMR